MQKDVIYIDVDDDITAVIGKVKAAKHSIVALVPPARVSMLQSAVNLRLLKKAAERDDKKLVLVSNNQQLANLAGMSGIPVAKTLQSKPELAQIDALDIDGEDVIDGSVLAVGEHATQAALDASDDTIPDQVLSKVDQTITAAEAERPSSTVPASRRKKSNKKKAVPNFNKFRKRLLIFGGLGVLLLGFLIWAIWFAPHAAITVNMKTNAESISQRVTLSDSVTTSADKNTVKAEKKQVTKDISASADATGEKDVGEKATGTVALSNASDSNSVLVPSGTTVTSRSGKQYTTNSSVTVPGATVSGGSIVAGSASVSVTAKESGTSYNGASGSATTNAGVSASFGDATSGGTDKVVKVAQASDIANAKESAQNSIDSDALQKSVAAEFDDNYIVLSESFSVNTSDLKSDVAAGSEASSGKVTVSGTVTATMYAVEKTELENYLKAVLETKLTSKEDQRIYDSGINDVTFTSVTVADDGITAGLSATGSVGPLLTEDQVKTLAAGKRYGEVQAELTAIQGVSSVSIDFSAFWVRTVPENQDKVTVEFKVNDQN